MCFYLVSIGYGMTEILITHATPRTDPKIGFCGKLLPHTQARVVDTEKGTAVPPGKKGELWIKSPCVSFGTNKMRKPIFFIHLSWIINW